jgi:hypothetical protein
MEPMSRQRETILAWSGCVIASLYFAWLWFMVGRLGETFSGMFEGLGAGIPPATKFLIDHHAWLIPVVFGTPIVGLILKECFLGDKRVSLMITLVVVILVRWAADVGVSVYYLPLMDMIRELSS